MALEPVGAIRRTLKEAPVEALDDLISLHSADVRAGVIEAVASASRRLDRHAKETRRLLGLVALERELASRGQSMVAGIDEVGRGALAGPVTAAAVILPFDFLPAGLTDSKRLDALARARFDTLIRSVAVGCSIAHVPPAEIDALGIGAATAEAMRRALAGLGDGVDHVLVDGLPVALSVPSTAVVKGDLTVRAIAAASIVAKVARDTLMIELDERFAPYGFGRNKGYGSPDHLSALDRFGPCELHRRSFAPCIQPGLF